MQHVSAAAPVCFFVPRYFHRFDGNSLIRVDFQSGFWHEHKPAAVAPSPRALDSLISFAILRRAMRDLDRWPSNVVVPRGWKKFRWRRKFALLARPIFENTKGVWRGRARTEGWKRMGEKQPFRSPDRPTPKYPKNTAVLSCLSRVSRVIYLGAHDPRLAE